MNFGSGKVWIHDTNSYYDFILSYPNLRNPMACKRSTQSTLYVSIPTEAMLMFPISMFIIRKHLNCTNLKHIVFILDRVFDWLRWL